jgi:DNA-binding NarL/FixJ family response regulator
MTHTKPSPESSTPRKARVFLVDDHPIVRHGFRMLCSLEPDLAVCGEAEGAAEACSKVTVLRPDVIVVDLSLKEGNGLDLIPRLRKTSPEMKILVFSMHTESAYVTRALLAGADDFIPKDEGSERVIAAIRSLLQGTKSGEPAGAEAPAGEPSAEASDRTTDLTHRLTGRELEVLHLMGKGFSSRQIAERLRVSMRTIDSHREHLKIKLGLKDAPALIHYALRFARFGDSA